MTDLSPECAPKRTSDGCPTYGFTPKNVRLFPLKADGEGELRLAPVSPVRKAMRYINSVEPVAVAARPDQREAGVDALAFICMGRCVTGVSNIPDAEIAN